MSSIDKTKELVIGSRDSGCWDNNVSLVLLIGFVNELMLVEIQYIFQAFISMKMIPLFILILYLSTYIMIK